MVDLLGGLVPGVLFFCAAGVVVIPVLHTTLQRFGKTTHPDLVGAVLSAVAATENTPSAVWLALLLLGVLVAYVVGHIFYRHDPNVPDRASFRWIVRFRRYKTPDDVSGKTSVVASESWQVRVRKFLFAPWELHDTDVLKGELGCTTMADCQFPYPYYDRYLKRRGLDHLLPWVMWTAQPGHRSKNHINRLKIALRHRVPNQCGSIVRNEAHVRLASTTWYVCNWLVGLSLLAGVWLIFLAYSPIGGTTPAFPALLPAAVCCVGVLAPSVYARISIQRFLHYQRMREVYYVLETASVVFEPPEEGTPREADVVLA